VTSADRKGILKVWNVADGRELATFKETEDRNPFSLAFSPDNRTLAAATWDGTILFDVVTRKSLRSLPAFGWLAFAPDGKILASSLHTAIHLWDPATGRELSPRPGHNGNVSFLTIASDGQSLASISPIDSAIRIWDLTSGKSLAALKGEWKRRNRIGAFSPDGKRFVSG
jgi:WD40 repeat protein